jgi:hypothetical protein
VSARDAERMRMELASAGILLDRPSATATVPATPAPRPAVDREQVRAILVAAGAPATDLEWLIASCPSLDDARGYQPPTLLPRLAWCVDCGDAVPTDSLGCIPCRSGRGAAS